MAIAIAASALLACGAAPLRQRAISKGGWQAAAWPTKSFDQSKLQLDVDARVAKPTDWWTVNAVSADSVEVYYFHGIESKRKQQNLRLKRSDVVLWSDFKRLPSDVCWGVKALTVEQGDWVGVVHLDRMGQGLWSDLNYPYVPAHEIPVEVWVADQWFVIRPVHVEEDLEVGETPVVVGALEGNRSGLLWGYESGGIVQMSDDDLAGCSSVTGPVVGRNGGGGN